MTYDLADRVREGLILPASLGLSVATFGDAPPPGLAIDAWPSLASAVPSRRREFLWGRRCARAALAAAGGDPGAPLRVDAERRPEWPDGWTGSISHAAGVAAAMAGPARDHPWLGLDVESFDALAHLDEIGPLVATATERSRLDRAEDLLAVFSAKEALFKALRPGRFMDFDAAELIAFDDADLTFRLTQNWSPRWRERTEVRARWFRTERWLFAAALPA